MQSSRGQVHSSELERLEACLEDAAVERLYPQEKGRLLALKASGKNDAPRTRLSSGMFIADTRPAEAPAHPKLT